MSDTTDADIERLARAAAEAKHRQMKGDDDWTWDTSATLGMQEWWRDTVKAILAEQAAMSKEAEAA